MIRVSVAIALPSRQEVIEIELPEGGTIAAALEAARVRGRWPELDVDACETGVWSKVCPRDTPLRDGDRVELYRALAADAKSMRRERALKTSKGSRGRR